MWAKPRGNASEKKDIKKKGILKENSMVKSTVDREVSQIVELSTKMASDAS